MQQVLHGGQMNIKVSNAILVSQTGVNQHRWAILSDQITAVCLRPRHEFPDVPSILEDMDTATWAVLRYDKPDVFLLISNGAVIGKSSASPPPLELVDAAAIIDSLSDERVPEGYTTIPIWVLAGYNQKDQAEH